MAPDTTDHELVSAVRGGDDRAFEVLYGRYHRRIAAYIYGMVQDHGRAEDIVQEVFISALRRMRETERPIAFKPWLYEIAKNACIDAFRRTRKAELVSYEAEEEAGGAEYTRLVGQGPTPDAAVDQKLSLDNLCGAFGGLSDTHHEILVMRELEGLSYREIGERLGMSRPSVESTLFRARRRLTEEYEELVSGERCQRVQSIIGGATGGRVAGRDEKRMARHVSHCQPCRRQAALAGFDLVALTMPKRVRTKIAAFLPLPAFVKRRWLGIEDAEDRPFVPLFPGHGSVAQWSTAAAQYTEPSMSGWAKAAAAAATIAVAGIGTGVAVHDNGLGLAPHDAKPSAVQRPAAGAPGAGGRDSATPPALTAGEAGARRTSGEGGGSGSSGSDRSPGRQAGATAGGDDSSSSSRGGVDGSASRPGTADGDSSGGGNDPSAPSSGTDTTARPKSETPLRDTVNGVLGSDGSGSGSGPVPDVPDVQVPRVPLPQVPGVPDPNGVVGTGPTGGVTGTVNDTVNDVTGTVNGTVNDTVGGTVGSLPGGGG